LPDGGIRKGELKLAAMFAKKKREILAMKKTKRGTKCHANRRKGIVQPPGTRGELRGPSVGGGEEDNPAWFDEAWQNLFKKSFGFGKTVDQVGG
jgi:hypothetical protein